MTSKPRLTKSELRLRFTCFALLPTLLLALYLAGPGSLPAWFPFAASCGAITGLPCIFCGMTRAFYYLLHGEFGRALYYNWLAFPFAASAIAIFFVNLLEIILNRKFLSRIPAVRLNPASWSLLAISFVLLWCLQVYLAVSQHKTELLNPNGPLYSLVVH
jgi:hypothetical protein